jgi:hypothetical protein
MCTSSPVTHYKRRGTDFFEGRHLTEHLGIHHPQQWELISYISFMGVAGHFWSFESPTGASEPGLPNESGVRGQRSRAVLEIREVCGLQVGDTAAPNSFGV